MTFLRPLGEMGKQQSVSARRHGRSIHTSTSASVTGARLLLGHNLPQHHDDGDEARWGILSQLDRRHP